MDEITKKIRKIKASEKKRLRMKEFKLLSRLPKIKDKQTKLKEV